jgi:hypothetical protein
VSGAAPLASPTFTGTVVADGLTVNSTALVTGVLTTTAATVFNGGFASNAASTIATTDNSVNLTLTSTDADASGGPKMNFYRNSASPAAGDILTQIGHQGKNDAGETVSYMYQNWRAAAVGDGAESGQFDINTYTAGTAYERMGIDPTETVFNNDSADLDFRVESDTNTHMLFMDAGLNTVCIGHGGARSSLALDVSGDIGQTWDDGEKFIGQQYSTGTYRIGIITDSADRTAQLVANAGDGSGKLEFYTNTNRAGLVSSSNDWTFFEGVTINENGNDNDFRVESDSNSHMLSVDAGNNRVGVGEGAPFTTLQVGARTGAGTTNPNTGSVLSVSKDGATGIDLGGNVNAGAVVGAINWVNYYGVGNYNTARIDTYAQGQSNSGELRFWTASIASSPTERMRISPTGGLITNPAAGGHAVFNENGVDADFRVESDTNAYALFVEGSSGNVGIGNGSPVNNLHVQGAGSLSGGVLRLSNTTADSTTAFTGIIFTQRQNNSDTDTTTAALGRGGRIISGRDGVYGGALSNHNSNLQFYTSNQGADTEAMRIDSSSNVIVGKTTTSVGTAGTLIAPMQTKITNNAATPQITTNNLGWGGVSIDFLYTGARKGYISVDSTSVAYVTSSDYRLKTDAQPMTGASARVQALKPVKHNPQRHKGETNNGYYDNLVSDQHATDRR